MHDVDCVIVSYNSAADLPRCVESVRGQTGVSVRVTVVDNASADDSVAVARALGARVIENSGNRGFAAAHNQAQRGATAPWLLILNPDSYMSDGVVARLVESARSFPRPVGCVGPRIVSEDGAEYPSGRRFPGIADALVHALIGNLRPDNPATLRYHARDIDRTRTAVVDWVSGSCMVVAREAWDGVGGLDEKYFMYVEDMDFCLRLQKQGWTTLYEPSVSLTHIGGRSSRTRRLRSVYHHHVGALRFHWRLSRPGPRLATAPLAAVFLGLRGLGLAAQIWVRNVRTARAA